MGEDLGCIPKNFFLTASQRETWGKIWIMKSHLCAKAICSILASREKQIEKIWNARKRSNLWESDRVSRKWKCCKFQWNVFVSTFKCIAIHWVQISVKFCTASGRMPLPRLLCNLLRAKWICPEHVSWRENEEDWFHIQMYFLKFSCLMYQE